MVKYPKAIAYFGNKDNMITVQPTVWHYVWKLARRWKYWARKSLSTPAWGKAASACSLEAAVDFDTRSVRASAEYLYSYLRFRAHMETAGGTPTDPASRDDWIAAGGVLEKLPKKEYVTT